MSSDSSNSTKKNNSRVTNSVSLPTKNKETVISSEESEGSKSSAGSKESNKSVACLPHPKITVLEQLSYKSLGAPNQYNENVQRATATTHNSTSPTVITAVLRDLRDDIVHSPTIDQGIGVLALTNGEKANAVIGSDNVYVQNKTKFIPVPREKALSTLPNETQLWPFQNSRFVEHSPLDVAVIVQKIFTPLSSVCFGLLGGVALLQLILVRQMVGDVTNEDQLFFLKSYSKFAEVAPLLFYILLAVCIVSILDRVSVDHPTEVWQPVWLVLAIYTLTLILTLYCASYDDRFILYHENKIFFENPMKTQELVSDWQLVNTLRCLTAIIGWVVFSLSTPPDLLLKHLRDIRQYKQRKFPFPTSTSTVHTLQ